MYPISLRKKRIKLFISRVKLCYVIEGDWFSVIEHVHFVAQECALHTNLITCAL